MPRRPRATRVAGIALALLGIACAAEAPREGPPHVLLLGLDGADWRVIDPLVAAGFLPNLASLLEGAARADLDCEPALPSFACFCPPVWVSIATGQPHAVHDVLKLTQLSTERRAPAVWTRLAERGGAVTLAGYRNTFPPEPAIGTLLTEAGLDFAASRIYAVWPLQKTVGLDDPERHAVPPNLLESLGLLPPTDAPQPLFAMLARDRVAMAALLRLAEQRPEAPETRPALTAVTLHGIDKVEHMAWAAVQPRRKGPIDAEALVEQAGRWPRPHYAPRPFGWGEVPWPYQEVDAWLGDYLAAARPDYVVLASDHGMGRNPDPKGLPGHHGTDVPEGHVGIFAVAGPGVAPGRLEPLTVLDVAPTLAYLLGLPVAEDLPGEIPLAAFTPAHRAAHPVETVPTWQAEP